MSHRTRTGGATIRRTTIALLLLAAALGGPRPSVAAHGHPVVPEAEWIMSLRVTSGPEAGLIDSNVNQGYCVPYFSNIGASGLAAATRATGDSRYVNAAWDWLDWYARRMDANGFVTNYRYVAPNWVSTGTLDSTDGYAGTFLIAVRDAYDASGNLSRLTALWPAVRKAVGAMLATDNGNWLTFAKPGYDHAFLMDNVEVYEAFRAIEHLAGEVIDDPELHGTAALWTANMPAALETYWNPAANGYDIAIGKFGERFVVPWATLYPGATAQSWMLRTGLVPPARTAALVAKIEEFHPTWDRSGEAAGKAWWPEIIEGMRFGGNPDRAESGLATMSAGVAGRGRAWPYHVANAGKLIMQSIGAPETVVTSGLPPYARPVAVSAAFAGVGDLHARGSVSYECSADGAPFAPCPASHSVVAATEGTHVLRVRLRDAAGNVDPTPAVLPWRVDGTPPEPALTATPTEPGNARPVFAFAATDARAPTSMLRFACSVDGGAFAPCASPATLSVTGTGTHEMRLKAIDPAGNEAVTPVHSWFADGTPPDTQITSGPAAIVPDGTLTFTFTGSDDRGAVGFECRVNVEPFAPCTSPYTRSLPEGNYTTAVRAVDGVGNPDPTPATRTVAIDRTPPETTLLDAPAANAATGTARFAFVGSDNVAGSGLLTFQCSLDGAPFTRCSSPVQHGALADGSHTFQVRTIDAAGYVDPSPARHTWIVDTVAPAVTLATTNDSVLVGLDPFLTREVSGGATDGTSGVSTVTVRYVPADPTQEAEERAAVVACGDATRRSCTWRASAPERSGRYRITATAVDAAGNTSPAGPARVVYVI